MDAMTDLKVEMREIRKEIGLMSQTLAKLASVEDRIKEIETETRDLPVIRSKVAAMIWGLSVIYVSLVGYVITNLK